MLADLLGIVIINTFVTLVFLIRDKPQTYYFRESTTVPRSIQITNFNMVSFNNSGNKVAPLPVIEQSIIKISSHLHD